VPLPDRLTWESSEPRTRGRAHWVSIDGVGGARNDAVLPDINEMLVGIADTLKPGAPAAPQKVPLFEHARRAGRVDLVRSGNTIEAVTRNVTELTLLLSPDQFDFDKPVKVTVNGRTAFEGRVEKSVATLMKWAARDNDRTMLFAAEVKVKPAR
jgi:hypothetical protein